MQGIEIFCIFVTVFLVTDIVCTDCMWMFVTEYLKYFVWLIYICAEIKWVQLSDFVQHQL